MKILILLLLASCSEKASFGVRDGVIQLTEYDHQKCEEVQRKYLCSKGQIEIYLNVKNE